jgi:hypothetical protein
MQIRLFKMGIEGKVAVANLVLLGLALAVLRVAFPEEVARETTSTGEVALAYGLGITIAVLSFPVGWLSLLFSTTHGHEIEIIAAMVYFPLNAYLWGYIVAAVARWRKRRSKPASP